MNPFGRFLIITGLLVALAGALIVLSPRIPWLGKLPGDILLRRGNVTFYFPLATSLLVSFILSIFLWLFRR